MDSKEIQAIRRIGLFTVTLYVKTRFTAPITCDATYNDLCFLQRLEAFLSTDCQVGEVAIGKMKGQLWYLSEDLAGLSIFSCKASGDSKKVIVYALSKQQNIADYQRVDPKTIRTFHEKSVSDFVTQRSLHLFMTSSLAKIFCHQIHKRGRTDKITAMPKTLLLQFVLLMTVQNMQLSLTLTWH